MKPSSFDFIEEIESVTNRRIMYIPGLWKKSVLLKYLVDYESAFMAEKIADFKSLIYSDGLYAVSRSYVEMKGQFFDCEPSGGLFRGKWALWVVPFFDSQVIKIDYEKRGFATDEFRKGTRLKSRVDLLRSPFLTMRSFIDLAQLFIRVKLINKME